MTRVEQLQKEVDEMVAQRKANLPLVIASRIAMGEISSTEGAVMIARLVSCVHDATAQELAWFTTMGVELTEHINNV